MYIAVCLDIKSGFFSYPPVCFPDRSYISILCKFVLEVDVIDAVSVRLMAWILMTLDYNTPWRTMWMPTSSPDIYHQSVVSCVNYIGPRILSEKKTILYVERGEPSDICKNNSSFMPRRLLLRLAPLFLPVQPAASVFADVVVANLLCKLSSCA